MTSLNLLDISVGSDVNDKKSFNKAGVGGNVNQPVQTNYGEQYEFSSKIKRNIM